MKKIYKWYTNLSKRLKDSLVFSISLVGCISTFLSIIGISLADIPYTNIIINIILVMITLLIITITAYKIIGQLFKDSIELSIRGNSVTIKHGDIFQESGYKIIGCDSHFDTRVDDIVITKSSLHGQLFLNHGIIKDINKVVEQKAKVIEIPANEKGLYDFPIGTIIRYDSQRDRQTYLMIAMINNIEEAGQYKVTTSMADYENMLMKMWSGIDATYAANDIVLPILGTGITRFEDGPKDATSLLRCMLCTLNSSGVTLNSNIKIVIYGDKNDIPLYEFKNVYRMIPSCSK